MTLSLVLGSEKLSIFAAMYGPGKKATLRRWVKRKVESPAWCGSVVGHHSLHRKDASGFLIIGSHIGVSCSPSPFLAL